MASSDSNSYYGVKDYPLCLPWKSRRRSNQKMEVPHGGAGGREEAEGTTVQRRHRPLPMSWAASQPGARAHGLQPKGGFWRHRDRPSEPWWLHLARKGTGQGPPRFPANGTSAFWVAAVCRDLVLGRPCPLEAWGGNELPSAKQMLSPELGSSVREASAPSPLCGRTVAAQVTAHARAPGPSLARAGGCGCVSRARSPQQLPPGSGCGQAVNPRR